MYMPRTHQFHPELFEQRAEAMQVLSTKGFAWMSDYNSIDLEHDEYGLEVCGIRERATALAIRDVMRNLFPSWRNVRVFPHDGFIDPGWRVQITKHARH